MIISFLLGNTIPVTAKGYYIHLPQTGAEISPSLNDMSLGRSSTNDIRIQDPAISRRHAVLRITEGKWYIQDLGSTSCTFVNTQRVKGARLQSGDKITLGNTTFKFRED